jgi:hypothetical protein
MIELKDLKVGRLYYTKNTNNDVHAYRVWLGKLPGFPDGVWSQGTTDRRTKSCPHYSAPWGTLEKVTPLKLSLFVPELVKLDAPSYFKPKKQYRYLNRPSEQV